jgi:3-methylcrotonyl-CoA carboxylase alpha subunit
MKPRQISRLLIANRGEIACRIVATCRKMGIETVTVFAGDDKDLPHASAGDFNCLLEGDGLAQTYLNMAQLMDVAKRTRANAIHPGYGFLSENAAFAGMVAKAGLIFVGPPAAVIARMGDKAASRQLCESIGVPVIPGYDGSKQDVATFSRAAAAIGYPVLVKASAGGGGKGMRVVERSEDLEAALVSARGEAEGAFGNGRLLLEKYLLQPRHIEVQVFSDTRKQHVHLFERECSIQRRHQKIIEESPAPNLPEATRQKLCAAAVAIARHIDYVGAGTVEFILDHKGEFFFLEMNTRLQVEHPVTELVTGLDLVRMQLEVAQGAALGVTQSDVQCRGHAVEARLYAEDAERGFLPAAGRLAVFDTPYVPGVRFEKGYGAGHVVSSRYDPMIAKIAAHGASRDEAIEALLYALSGTVVAGIVTNRGFLTRVLDSTAFRAGQTATDFLVRHADVLAPPAYDDALLAEAVAAHLLAGETHETGTQEHSAWTQLAGFRCS